MWGYGYEGYEHTVNSHINRLRSKIEKDPARPRYVLSVRGVGYKFSELDELNHKVSVMIKNLYQRLAAVLLGLFLLVGVLYIVLTVYTTRLYFQEVNQKLNRILAKHLVSENILLKNGQVDDRALQNIFHMLMLVNPVIEVYLLDPKGTILSYSAPPGKVKRQSVSLDPVKRLLSGTSSFPVLGDDPRDLRQKKIFSVAPIYRDGRIEGYLYIILGSEAFENEAEYAPGQLHTPFEHLGRCRRAAVRSPGRTAPL